MVYHMKSDMCLTEKGIEFVWDDAVEMISYNKIVWVYMQRRIGDDIRLCYDLADITADMPGDIVIVDEQKNTYIFEEIYLKDAAGEKFNTFMLYDTTCLAGYSNVYEQMYREDFAQLVRARQIMWDVWAVPDGA